MRGLRKVPLPYQYLAFSRYDVFAPRDPAWEGIISPNDLSCAVSAPNALIGSRYRSDALSSATTTSEGAYFEIANASALADEGLHPYFSLLSFHIKPLDAPESGTKITVNGYSHAHKDPLSWSVYLDNEFHEPVLIKIEEFSKHKWSQLYGVEILADYGEDALDWEFCLDDLEVQFFKATEEKIESRPWYQRILRLGAAELR